MAEDAYGSADGDAAAPLNQTDIDAALAVAEGSGPAEADPALADSTPAEAAHADPAATASVAEATPAGQPP